MESNVVRLVTRRERDSRREVAESIYLSLSEMENKALAAGFAELGMLIGVAALAAKDIGEPD